MSVLDGGLKNGRVQLGHVILLFLVVACLLLFALALALGALASLLPLLLLSLFASVALGLFGFLASLALGFLGSRQSLFVPGHELDRARQDFPRSLVLAPALGDPLAGILGKPLQ